MHYQIYLPGVKVADSDRLVEAGLGHLRGGEEYFPDAYGPDGKGGMVVTWRGGNGALPFGFRADEQEWIEGEKYWVGIWNDSPPLPSHLQKKPLVPGFPIELGDRRQWIVPIAEMLPKDVLIDQESVQSVVKEQFSDFWEESTRWARWFLDADLETPPEEFISDLTKYVLKALQLNYNIIPELVNYYRLLDYHSIARCVTATLHKPDITSVELEKKTMEFLGIPDG